MFLLQEIMGSMKLENSRELIAIVGAGGKTGTMFTLAKALKTIGKRVLVTTTTAIYQPPIEDYDQLITGELQGFLKKSGVNKPRKDFGEIVVWGKETDKNGKLQGVSPEDIDKIWEAEAFSWILVEGDGAKRKSIKAPKETEPVIPSKTTVLLGVIGMQVLGKPVNEGNIHRVEYFTKITESKIGDSIDEVMLRRLILHKQGLFKGKPGNARAILLLNQCEEEAVRNRAMDLGERLSISYLVTSLHKRKVYGARIINEEQK